MKKIWLMLFIPIFLILSCNVQPGLTSKTYDVVIYGGTSAGISAAVQTVRMGKSVIVVHPDKRIGGLTAGGLGQTDIGNKHVIGGIAKEFYTRIKEKYSHSKAWTWQKKEDYFSQDKVQSKANEEAMWTFEPKVALDVFHDLIKEYKIPVLYNERLDLQNGVIKTDNKIQSILLESGKTVNGKIFIDATYEGDLLAVSGVSYTVGRESNEKYNETLNGVQTKMGIYHQFPQGVDPYVIKGDPSSGLLPNINATIAKEGDGDKKVQAYCFRMCLTSVPENRVPLQKPKVYNEMEYELLFRAIEAGYQGPFFIMSKMPNHKTDSNNKGPVSSDYIGKNYDYAEADYETREQIIKEHEIYQKGLLWTLSNHPRIPEEIREEFSRWGLPKDEFKDNGHWTPQLYIREARRIVSDFVMTQQHCTQELVADQSVGMGAYTMDSHHVQRYIDENGFVRNEGDVEVGGFGPYPISYRAIVPKESESTNLLVPVCLSASHMAFGSIRMEPVFMVLGQSAATVACLAIDENKPVQYVDYPLLRKQLLADKQILNN